MSRIQHARLKAARSIEAEQFDGITIPSLLWKYMAGVTVGIRDDEVILRFGDYTIFPGDWVVRGVDGDPEYVSQFSFNERYELE